jgi:Flp pilus assembly pilin Flp
LAEYALVLTLLACAFMAGMNLVERAAGQALTNVETGLLNYATRTGT